jgi:DinB superfamily
MDAIGFFLSRYGDIHGGLVEGLFAKLSEAQLRTRPHQGVNTISWLVWHSARIEDLALNRFLSDRRQVLDEGWRERLAVPRRDVGTGMTDAQVDELSARIDLAVLKGYWDAVTARTLEVVESLRGSDLEALVPAEQVRAAVRADDAVAPGVEWLTEFWAGGRTRAWMLAQTALLHPYGHYYEARVVSGLWGLRSP